MTKIREYLHLVRRTAGLDVFDVNYLLCSEKQDFQGYFDVRSLARIPYLSSQVSFVRILLKALFLLVFRRKKIVIPQGGIALMSVSKNNTNALMPIKDLYSETAYFIESPHQDPAGPSVYISSWVSLLFIPCFLWKFFRGSAYEKRSLSYGFCQIFISYGYYFVSSFWLVKNCPKLVVFANDHLNYPRALRLAAHDLGIKTLYLQHASVTSNFPPIDYDYACLDGRIALEHYREAGQVLSTVFLVGMAKSGELETRINVNSRVKAVGICLNLLDRVDVAEKLLIEIHNTYPDLVLAWRPHPAMKDQFAYMKEWGENHDVRFSSPMNESIWDFLGNNDLLIAENSSVHVEATLMNVLSVYFRLGDKLVDYYSYIKNGLVDECDEVELLAKLGEWKERKPDIRFRAANYCADIGTQYEGRPNLLLKSALEYVLEKKDPSDVFNNIACGAGDVYTPSMRSE